VPQNVIRAGSEDGRSLVIHPSYPRKRRDASGNYVLTYRYWCLADSAEGLLPAVGSAPPDTGHPTLELTTVDIVPRGNNPGIVDVEIIYAVPDLNQWIPVQPGEVRYEVDTTVQDAPLADQAIDDTAASEADKNIAINDAKKETYLAPVPIFRRIENVGAFTYNFANVVDNVGKRQDPTGYTAGADDDDSNGNPRWLKTRKSVTTQGSRWIVTEEWAFATAAWSNWPYENA